MISKNQVLQILYHTYIIKKPNKIQEKLIAMKITTMHTVYSINSYTTIINENIPYNWPTFYIHVFI